MKSNLTLRLCLFFLIILFSCTKEGSTGSQGPAGPQGPQGNAKVKTTIFTNQPFTQNPLAGGVYQVLVTVHDITAYVLQKGTVNAYVSKANNQSTDWTALPGDFTPDFNNPALSRFYNFNYGSGGSTIYTTSNPGYNVDVKLLSLQVNNYGEGKRLEQFNNNHNDEILLLNHDHEKAIPDHPNI